MDCKAARIGHKTHIVTGYLAESATGGLFFSLLKVGTRSRISTAVESVASFKNCQFRKPELAFTALNWLVGNQMI
jgi:hypothetical protein